MPQDFSLLIACTQMVNYSSYLSSLFTPFLDFRQGLLICFFRFWYQCFDNNNHKVRDKKNSIVILINSEENGKKQVMGKQVSNNRLLRDSVLGEPSICKKNHRRLQWTVFAFPVSGCHPRSLSQPLYLLLLLLVFFSLLLSTSFFFSSPLILSPFLNLRNLFSVFFLMLFFLLQCYSFTWEELKERVRGQRT